jgi:IS30 family transposase
LWTEKQNISGYKNLSASVPVMLPRASNRILASVAKHIHTITADNGSGFAAYEEIETCTWN